MNQPVRSAALPGLPLRPSVSSSTPTEMLLPRGASAATRTVLGLLKRIEHGTLDLRWPDGSHLRLGSGLEPRATLVVHDQKVFTAALKSGDIGFAEAFIAGDWDTDDLPALLRLLLLNREAIERLIFGGWWGSLLHRLQHWRNRNSREGSRRNIHAHYDLGNAFYRLWLDATMNYSSAWFDGDHGRALSEAQDAKVARALAEAGVQPGSRVLEIGCGWGAVAEAAARRGAHLTGVTLSTEQLAWAQERLARQGLGGQAELRLQDYRDIADAPFDALVSIEMFEAVERT